MKTFLALALLAGARAADEAGAVSAVGTDEVGLWSLGYYWYGIIHQPSFHQEWKQCYNAMGIDDYYGYGQVAYCQFLNLFIEKSDACHSNYKYMCEEDDKIKMAMKT